jgi:hypothetical protein
MNGLMKTKLVEKLMVMKVFLKSWESTLIFDISDYKTSMTDY